LQYRQPAADTDTRVCMCLCVHTDIQENISIYIFTSYTTV